MTVDAAREKDGVQVTAQSAPSVRLVRLHLASRQVPACLLVLAVLAVTMGAALHWTPASGTFARLIPLIIETAAAAAVGATTRSPFGESERAPGAGCPTCAWARSSRWQVPRSVRWPQGRPAGTWPPARWACSGIQRG